MLFSLDRAVRLAWLLWILSWFAAAVWARRPAVRVGWQAEVPHLALTIAGFVMIFSRSRPGWSGPVPEAAGWLLFALVLAGFVFCWWARLHLGVLWSGSVTRKEGHRVIDTGPYALVRHPIYTGLILACAATALLRGTALSLAGVALVVLGFWLKARLEERFLRAELGAGDYDAYARRTPMLIPWPRRPGVEAG